MAAIVTGCLGAVGGRVGELILRQLNYLYCFSDNITNLRNEADNLKVLERDLQVKVQAARDAVRFITNEAETWLKKSNEINDEINEILSEVPNVESCRFRLGARFSLSKRAEDTAGRVKKLLGEYKFNTHAICRPRSPAATKVVPLRTYEFESRIQIEGEIMETLRGEDVNMVGICGMGGLGKTTMAKRIMNRALEENVFEEVVMAVVSRAIDKLKIQLEIGGSLGLKLEGESSQARMQKLHKRLSGTKRTLVVLDDVWETLELEDLGIPHSYEGCTILLTSRSRDVLSGMSVNIFGMELLSEEDSWFLFKEKVGSHEDDTELNSIAEEDTELNSIAKEVVKECGRLPIALITVGAALKDKVHVAAWRNALRQLKRHDPDIPNFIEKVYKPLELSYDVLEHKYQLVFLLCGLYPEDADIPLERLTYFCMGLRLFDGGMVEERERMHSLIDVLKHRSLLLDSNRGDDYVRMHDVVRDVCKHITRKNKYISRGDSSLQSYEFISGFGLLQIRNSADEEIKFVGISDLYVLSIERCSQLTSLPFTQRPNNLITLVLDSCWGLKTLSVVGELVNLEILICRDCYWIQELPPEIKELKQLKVLELTGCLNLKRIGRGIISSLVGLEELKMLQSFDKWEAEDREERENAGLRELGQLPNLRCLEIEIEDLALAAENIRLSSEVDRFTIRFLYQSRWFSEFDEYLSNKKMCLNWEGASCLGDWIKVQLLRDTECLLLVGNGANEALGLTNLEKIRYLELRECESMKKVVTSSMDKGGATVFPSIENLLLFKLPKLEEICDDRIWSNSFQNLKKLTLDDLPVLKQLWKSSQNDLGKDFLPQLEDLYIENCGMMETVFLWKGEDGNENTSCHHITKIFPKLKELELEYLPNLISLCQGIEGIEFPLMRKIIIIGCGKMKGMVWNEKISGGSSNNASINALFCPQQVSLGCLKKLDTDRSSFSELEELKIIGCESILSLFTSSMAGNLVNLKELWIAFCVEMVEVIKDDEEKGMSSGRQTALLFPNLHTLELKYLPKLVSFCESKGIESIQFPVLRSMQIKSCKEMKGMVANRLTSNENNSGGSSTNAEHIIHLFCQSKQVSFGCLKKLDTDRNSFSELEELQIFGCQSILSLFTSSMAGNLVSLKELRIGKCDEMVEVIKDDEEKGMSVGQRTLLFPKLQKLELSRLPKLVSFCESKGIESIQFPKLHTLKLEYLPKLVSFCESKGIESIQFPVLRSMKITGCEKLKGMVANGVTSNENNSGGSSTSAADIIHLFCQSKQELKISGCRGILSLFTSSMAGNLLNLKELWIMFCDEMVEVIKDDEEKGMSGGRQTALLFPKLHTLKLEYLPKLVSFCKSKGIESIQFPVLRIMKIRGCEKMKGMVANGVTSNENNSGGDSSNASDTIHLFCESQQVSFGCLKQLNTDRNPFCCHTIRVSLLNGLEELEISNCAGSRSLFTSSMAGNLLNLKELRISECEEMVEVMKDSEEKCMSGGRQRALLFPKLHRLTLRYSPNLLSFCEWKCDVEFPSLRKVHISNCPNMKNFTFGSLAAPNLESFVTDLNNYLLQVPFISRKKLSVLENEKPLNCYQIHGSVFDRLEELTIYMYYGSMSLFSSSITGNLVNLTTLTIESCYKMVKVIEEKEEEKEKVVSGAQRTTILFPKLQKIELWYLDELVRFCEWKCDVELPSLRKVVINHCHNMKSFTLGPLNTPKLESVRINYRDVGGVKDLNGLVQQQYINRTEEKQAEEERIRKVVEINWKEFGGLKDLNDILQQQYINRTEKKQAEEAEKKKGGEEEQERKGEIEEEQN